jgi:hypothetical protein
MKYNFGLAFAEALKKSGVESLIKERKTLQDQITGILNPERKFRSISEKIKDMQERAGIYKLKGVKKAMEEKEMFIKTFDKSITLFEKFPNLKQIIIDYIEENPFKDQPAILQDVKKAVEAVSSKRGTDVDVMSLMHEDSFQEFINQLLEKTRKSKELNITEDIKLSDDGEITTEDENLNSDILGGAQKLQ